MWGRNMKFLSSKPWFVYKASALLFLGVLGWTQFVYPQETQNRGRQNAGPATGREQQNPKSPQLELLPVQGSISMLAGAGSNITVQAGKDGILLVDTGAATMSDKVVEAIRTLAKRQVTYIINTSDRTDHVGGNENFAKIGSPLAIARAARASVFIIGFSTILERMSDPSAKPSIPEKAWPNDTYSVPQKNLYFNGEAIQIFHQPGTTDGNSIVFFRRSDVVSAGDIFNPTEYPIIDLNKGGSLQGVIDGLNRLRQMAIPADHMEGGTMIILGHGRLADDADLDIYQQMVTIVR